jgi:hypothetical protein
MVESAITTRTVFGLLRKARMSAHGVLADVAAGLRDHQQHGDVGTSQPTEYMKPS